MGVAWLGLVGLGAVGPAAVTAGGTATVESPRGDKTEIAWREPTSVRMGMPNQSAYMLVREGRLYSVQTARGRTMVMDMTAMGSRIPGGAAPSGVASATALVEMRPTGRRETLAGVEGEVYRVTWRNSEGREQTDVAVLSRDDLAVELTRAFHQFSRAQAKASGQSAPDAMGEALVERGLGILRFSDRLQVAELSGEAPPASAFELPAEPMRMPDMPAGRGR